MNILSGAQFQIRTETFMILSHVSLPIGIIGHLKCISLFPGHQRQWVRNGYEFQKPTRLTYLLEARLWLYGEPSTHFV